MSVGLDFVSAGCNCLHGCAEWGENGLVAFGAGRMVGLYDAKARRLVQTLRGHSDRVNVVRWLSAHELVSAGSDGKVLLWTRNDESGFV